MVLRAFIPGAVARVDHEPLLHQAAGTMVAIALLGSTLLRATNDVKLWKIYQGSVWTIDVIGLWSLYTILGGQGRLHPSAWRGEDWGCVGISVLSTLVRSLFVLGVGLRKGDERFKLA